MTGSTRDILAHALFPGGAERAAQQVRSAWHAALLSHADLRPQLRVVAVGEHVRELIPSAGSWDAVAGLPDVLQTWWMREAASWQRRILQLAGAELPERLCVAIPDGRAGAVAVALFDFLEAAWRVTRLCGEPWRLAFLEIRVREDPKQLGAARAAINGFWDRDAERIWEGSEESDRLPVACICQLQEGLVSTSGADWILDSPILATRGGAPPAARRPALAVGGAAAEATGRYFLERFFGHPHFRPGQWPAIAHALAGRSVVAALPPRGGRALCYELPALLLPGVALIAAPPDVAGRHLAELSQQGYELAFRLDSAMPEAERQAVLAKLEAGRAKLLFVMPELLQDQTLLQRLRHAVRRAPGGIGCFAIEDADMGSEWSDAFRPAFANLPAAFAELGGAPVIALPGASRDALLADVQGQFGVPAAQVVAVANAAVPALVPAVAPSQADYPGYKFEMAEHREQFERMGRHLEKGGFASLSAFMGDMPRWDGSADRPGRIRTWLVRLQGLGHIASFGENKTTFFVKHEFVPQGDPVAYLGRLRARASELLKGEVPPEFANAEAGDLCEALVMRVLNLGWQEARFTALFFDKYIGPFLGRKGSIEIPKAEPPVPARGPETERLLYRLKRLGIVREYFAEPRGDDPDEALRWGVAVRRFDRAAFEPGLRAALGAFSLEEGMVTALLAEYHAAVSPAAAPADVVLAGLETYLKAYYAVHVRRRREALALAGAGGGRDAGGPPADLLDLITAEEWHQAAQRRERDRLAPLLDQEAETLAATGALPEAVAWFAARGRLSSLRELARECAAAEPGRVAPHLVECAAHQALGHLDAAVAAIRRALQVVGPAAEGKLRAVLTVAAPAVRLAVLDDDLVSELGLREVRRWRHDAARELRRPEAAASELLAELRSISTSWREAGAELAALGPVLAKLEAV